MLTAALLGPGTLQRAARGGNDFTAFYTGGRLAFSGNLYNRDRFINRQTALTGWKSDELVFVRLPWQAVLFAPISRLDFASASRLWFSLNLMALLLFACCWTGVPPSARALTLSWSVPAVLALVGGQDVPLIMLAMAGGFVLIERQRPFSAGLCLALCAAKPQLFWPLGLVFLSRRMWAVCAGGLVALGVLAGMSCLGTGTDWFKGFAETLGYINGKARLDLMPTLPAAMHGAPGAGIAEFAAIALTVAAVVLIPDWKMGAAIAIPFGIATAPHAFLVDCAFVLIPLFLLWKSDLPRAVLLAMASPLATVPAVLGHSQWTLAVLVLGSGLLIARECVFHPRPIKGMVVAINVMN